MLSILRTDMRILQSRRVISSGMPDIGVRQNIKEDHGLRGFLEMTGDVISMRKSNMGRMTSLITSRMTLDYPLRAVTLATLAFLQK